MGDDSKIQWTDATWNPTRGCSRVSPGCDNCYAMGQAHRFSAPGRGKDGVPQPYAGLTTIRRGKVDWSGRVILIPEMLDRPLRWKRPRRVFVNSMSDLFHEALSNEEIAAVFGVMAAAPQHQFQVLTKRAKRMREWFEWCERRGEQGLAMFPDDPLSWRIGQMLACELRKHGLNGHRPGTRATGYQDFSPQSQPWPLPNVWLGCSTENQEQADKRIPDLLACPAAVRLVSAEPLLGPIELNLPTRKYERAPSVTRGDLNPAERQFFSDPGCAHCCNGDRCDDPTHLERRRCPYCRGTGSARVLDWVIVGGESGPGARTCEVNWVRSIVEQCHGASVACFVKQLGAQPILPAGENLLELPDGVGWIAPELDGEAALLLNDRKGGDPSEWPMDLRVREFPA